MKVVFWVCCAAFFLASRVMADQRNPRSYGGGGTHSTPAGSERGYQFEYSFADAGTGWVHSRDEWSDGDITRGSYDVLLPDGRIQRVTYTADHEGFKPVITYEIPEHTTNEYGFRHINNHREKVENTKLKKPIALPTEGFRHYTYMPRNHRPSYRERYLNNHLYDHTPSNPYKHTTVNSYHLASKQFGKKSEEINSISIHKEENHPVKNMVKQYQSRYNHYNLRHPSPPPGYSPEKPRSYKVIEGHGLPSKSTRFLRKPTNAHSKSYSKAVTEHSDEFDISNERLGVTEIALKETQVQKTSDHKLYEKDISETRSTTESIFAETSKHKLNSPFMKKIMTTMLPPDKPFLFTTYYTPKKPESLVYTTPLPFVSKAESYHLSDQLLRPTPRPAKILHNHPPPIPSKSSHTYIPVYATTPLPTISSTVIPRHMVPPDATPFRKRSYHKPATPITQYSSLKNVPSRHFHHPAHPLHHLPSHHTYPKYPTETPPLYKDPKNEIQHFSPSYEPRHYQTSQYLHPPYQPSGKSSIQQSDKLPTHQFYPPRPLRKPNHWSSLRKGPPFLS